MTRAHASLLPVDADSLTCCAGDVARGIARLFHRHALVTLCEVPLPNGRRADLLAIDAKGQITIVEIKVARADLLGDAKWPDYLDWCDRFFWGLSPALDPALCERADCLPERSGLIVADRYDAAVLREAACFAMSPARRRSELLRIGRLAMQRIMRATDPDLAGHAGASDIGL